MYKKTARELHQDFVEGSSSAKQIVSYFLDRIHAFNPKVEALLTVLNERAMAKAEALDEKRRLNKPLGKLAGSVIIVKDNMHIKNEKTTCASKFLEHYKAPFSATVVDKIEQEDGIILGKANLDEFAMGSSTEYSAFCTTKNPWDTDLTAGGSSGGSAVSVAANFAPLALGSDTGGSIRQPAAFCGIYGFKPTYGRVSRFGLVAFGSSLDQIGPFARSVEDIALMQEVIASPCQNDSTSIQEAPPAYRQELSLPIKGKKIGVPVALLEEADPVIREAMEEALKVYKSLGCELVEINLSSLKYSIPVYYILATAEASTNLARFDGIRYTTRSKVAQTLEEVYELSRGEGFGAEVKQRIFLGTYVLSAGYQDAYYKKAQKVRTLMIEDYKRAFALCDMIALPTTSTTAFRLASIQDPLKMYMQDIYTISANLVGIPTISMPIGFEKKKKPIGMQLQAPLLKDAEVLTFASHFAKATSFHTHTPPLFDKEPSL
jgi:aspartyl-tRNA(Asn)/glutamyl-tRNA(Gln) amidotransferase subunit A